MSDQTLLSLHSLGFERDDVLLFSGVSLDVCAGTIWQVLGPNGVGKTTLIRILATLLIPTQGELRWKGKPLSRARQQYLSNLLYIGHSQGVKPGLTPVENLNWWAGLQGFRNLDTESVFEQIGLSGYQDSPCYQLSAGQLRRVALCRMLVSDAPLWILDEPFTAIDKQGVQLLEGLLDEHASKGGAVIFSSHQDMSKENIRQLNLLNYCASLSGDA